MEFVAQIAGLLLHVRSDLLPKLHELVLTSRGNFKRIDENYLCHCIPPHLISRIARSPHHLRARSSLQARPRATPNGPAGMKTAKSTARSVGSGDSRSSYTRTARQASCSYQLCR